MSSKKLPLSGHVEIAVLCGAVSPERDVSLRSGKAVAEALEKRHAGRVKLHQLEANLLPDGLDPARHVIFPVIHGDYGEDGGIQGELDARGFAYVGCGAEASRICINKAAAKQRFRQAGVAVAAGFAFNVAVAGKEEGGVPAKPSPEEIFAALGSDDIVLKPVDKGSSVGLHFLCGAAAVASALAGLPAGRWLAEARETGREMTVGILNGKALGIVEIRPAGGRYDYSTKYTAGASEYIYPAPVAPEIATAAAAEAERIFQACGCRDFARPDFILRPDGSRIFLEINTMPGMTATSLFPKSASCQGLDFETLCERMVQPALARFAVSGAARG
ncbi:MAG: D-alanine--D-alanine ligase [Puniceicoccales bacterium]|jgi:D-alanine-D-alanine ligase|nr:D-alanine--D-alanine ligase [Puniceicoccales bacterium]